MKGRLTVLFFIAVMLSINFAFAGSVANTTTNWLHNESDSQFSAYQQMKNASTELAMVTSSALSINTAGIICWDNNWTTQNFTSTTSLNGVWNFSINYTRVAGGAPPTLYLFAKIFKLNSTGTRSEIANSSQSANVGGQTTNVAVKWGFNLTVSPLTNITAGERVGVQFCMNITDKKNKDANIYWENSTQSFVIIPLVHFDNILPTVNISYPQNATYKTNVSTLNYTATDANLQACWYSINSGVTNTTVTCGQNITGLTSTEGGNTWRVYANDSFGNQNSSSVTFIKDTIAPTISIISPANTTYGSISQLINISTNGASTVWFFNGTGNTTYTTPVYQNFNDGSHTITAYANDSAGNLNFTSVTFFVDTCVPNLVNSSWSDWINTTCSGTQMNQSRYFTQYDNNYCGEVSNVTYYEYKLVGPSLLNTTFNSWYDISSCYANDTKEQAQNATQYDTYSCTANTTVLNYQSATCDYCTPTLANTSWSPWTNTTCADTQMNQSQFLTQYDSSNCYSQTGLASDNITNSTFYQHQLVGPSYLNATFSPWYDVSSCYSNDTKDQEQNATQYDEYNCAANTTVYNYQSAVCDFCVPFLANQTGDWMNETCLASDLMNQSRTITQYDTLFCGEVSNVTFTEYRATEPCDFCTPNLVNDSWSEWSNEVCSGSQMNQSRYLTQYDNNFCGEVSNVTYYEYRLVGPILMNTSFNTWYDISECYSNDTKDQAQNATQYDNYGCTANITVYNYQSATCDYCTPSIVNDSWSEWTNVSCSADNMNQSRFLTEYDELFCGEVSNVTYFEYSLQGPAYANTTFGAWANISSCYPNNTMDQEQNATQYDEYGCAANTTVYEYQSIACDACTPSLSNTSWSEWTNVSCSTSQMNQSQFLVQYDSNFCGEVENETITEYHLVGPSLMNNSFSEWSDVSSCYANDTKDQVQNATQYDEYGCAANITVFNYQSVECDFCVPVLTNQTGDWMNETCLASDLMNQSRTIIQYDTLFCGEISNVTFTEYRATEPCDACTPNLVNDSWSGWVDETCLDTQMNQSRYFTQYDNNYCGEIANVTYYDYQFVGPSLLNTSFDEWSDASGCYANNTVDQAQNATQYDHYGCIANETVYNYQSVSCDACMPSVVNSSWSEWSDVSCVDSSMNQSRFLTEYDSNFCDEVSNVTYYEYQLNGPDYVNTSWSDWLNLTCLNSSIMNQSRQLTQFDSFGCGLNVTFVEYQAVEYCNYSAPDTSGPVFTNLANQTMYDNESLSYDIDAVDVSGVSCFSVNDTASFNIDCSGMLTDVSALNIGMHWLEIGANDSLGNVNSEIIYVDVLNSTLPAVDSDGDGIPDDEDPLWFSESAVNTTGVSGLNITVGGNSTDGIFSGVQEVVFYDATGMIINFTFNFSESVLDLSKVTIIKGTNSLVVNFSGQIQLEYNKTLYIEDNSFASLCVKDAEIAAISSISADCNSLNETDFTDCIGNAGGITINSITCSDLGEVIRVSNLRYSGIIGVPEIIIGGGICASEWTCTAWNTCANGVQTRSCTDTNCHRMTGGPSEQQSCACVENWSCGSWSNCDINGKQTRTCSNLGTCFDGYNAPTTEQNCVYIAPNATATERALFDIALTVITPQVNAGENLSARVSLFNFGNKTNVNVTLNYIITDPENNIVLTAKEIVPVEIQNEFIKEFALPLKIMSGNYKLFVEINYPGQETDASSQDSFNVIGETPLIISSDKTDYWSMSVLIVIIISILGINLMIKKYKRDEEEKSVFSLTRQILKKRLGKQD